MTKYIAITTILLMIFVGSFSQNKCSTSSNIPSQKQSDSALNEIIKNSYNNLKQANDTLKRKQTILYRKIDAKMSNKR